MTISISRLRHHYGPDSDDPCCVGIVRELPEPHIAWYIPDEHGDPIGPAITRCPFSHEGVNLPKTLGEAEQSNWLRQWANTGYYGAPKGDRTDAS